jgi:hypothetical protein
MQTGEDSVLDRNATEDLKEPVGASGSSVEGNLYRQVTEISQIKHHNPVHAALTEKCADEVEDYPSEKEEFASEDESSHGILAAAVAVTISPYSSCSGSEADYDFSDSTDSSTPRSAYVLESSQAEYAVVLVGTVEVRTAGMSQNWVCCRTPKRRRDRAAEDTVRELLLDQVECF